MSTAVTAVIFDLDGTLLNSVDLHAHAWQEALEHFGHHIPFDKIRSQIGKGGDQLLPFLLTEDEVKDHGKRLEKYRGQLFKDKFLHDVKPFPRVRELLQHVLSCGQIVALASSAKADELESYKKIAGIDDLVQAETSSTDAEKSKPHPDIFEAALTRLGLEKTPEQAIVVGDTPHDGEAANQAHVPWVGVLCGGFAESDLRKSSPLAIFNDPADLLDRYAESPLA